MDVVVVAPAVVVVEIGVLFLKAFHAKKPPTTTAINMTVQRPDSFSCS